MIISTFFALLVAGGGYFIGSFSHLFSATRCPRAEKDFIVPQMLNIAGAAQYSHRYRTGAADLRIGFHPVQHHPYRLLNRDHGFGKGKAETQ